MTDPSAVAIRRSPEILQAQEEQRAAETFNFLAARELRREVAKARGHDYKQIFPSLKQAAPDGPPGPMPQTGLWRCKKKVPAKSLQLVPASPHQTRQDRKNSCPCHQNHTCLEWDRTAPCRTSYEEALPGARAKVTKPPSITSTVGTVSADSL